MDRWAPTETVWKGVCVGAVRVRERGVRLGEGSDAPGGGQV